MVALHVNGLLMSHPSARCIDATPESDYFLQFLHSFVMYILRQLLAVLQQHQFPFSNMRFRLGGLVADGILGSIIRISAWPFTL